MPKCTNNFGRHKPKKELFHLEGDPSVNHLSGTGETLDHHLIRATQVGGGERNPY